MVNFSPQLLDEIRMRIKPSDVIGRKVQLKKLGHTLKGLCPFHNEKTPSFNVSDDKEFYHCFGCGAHGDIFTFVMETNHLSFPEAVIELASQAGVTIPQEPYTPEQQAAYDAKEKLQILVELACKWFQKQLRIQQGSEALEYLRNRRLDDNTIAAFRLGYAPNQFDALQSYLRGLGHSDAEMLEAGLLSKNDRGTVYDRFRHRVMFPITDAKGKVVAFGGRVLDDNVPKYLNSPETPLFHKSSVLYNEYKSRNIARQQKSIFVTEGYMDVIALDAIGVSNAVAPLGTAFTEQHLQRLWRICETPVLCFDGDQAGRKAMHRAALLALPHLTPGLSLNFAWLPEGMDPDDVIIKSGSSELKQCLESPMPLSEVIWRFETKEHSVKTPEQKAALAKRLEILAGQIKDQKVQQYYKAFFKERLWQNYRHSYRQTNELHRGSLLKGQSGIDIDTQSKDGSALILLCLVFYYPQLLAEEAVLDVFCQVSFSSNELDKIQSVILQVQDSGQGELVQTFRRECEKSGVAPSHMAILERIKQQVMPAGFEQEQQLKVFWNFMHTSYYLATLREEYASLMQEMTEEAYERSKGYQEQIQELERKITQLGMNAEVA